MIKRILPIAILWVASWAINAQTINKDTTHNTHFSNLKYRITAGYGQSYLLGNRFVTSPYQSIYSGVNVELPIRYGIGVETGLKYNYMLGKKTQRYAHNQKFKFTYDTHQFIVPINAIYTSPTFWGLKLFAFAGANFNISLYQTQTVKKSNVNTTGVTNSLSYPKAGTFHNVYNRLNFQLGAGGGIQWKQFRLRGGYDWGINNLNKNSQNTAKLKGWYTSFEYQF